MSTEFIQKLMSVVEDGSDTAEANKLYHLLPQHSGGTDPWNKGTTLQNIVFRHISHSK